MIFQHFNLLSAKTVEENVALPLKIEGRRKAERLKRAAELLDLVGLSEKAKAYPSSLSGGQKQRVGIARALAARPALLLSDEATSALDPETTRSILALLKDINRKLGLTILLITHEMEVVRGIADRVAVIDAGRIVEEGPVWSVFADPQSEITRSLLGGIRPQLPDQIASAACRREPGARRSSASTSPATAAQGSAAFRSCRSAAGVLPPRPWRHRPYPEQPVARFFMAVAGDDAASAGSGPQFLKARGARVEVLGYDAGYA